MLCSVETMSTLKLPSPRAPNLDAASDGDPEQVPCLPAQAILAQWKVMNLSKRIRSLIYTGSATEGYISVPGTPLEAMTTCTSPYPTTEKVASDGPQSLASILSPGPTHMNTSNLSKRIRSLVMGPASEGYSSLSDSQRCSGDGDSDLQENSAGGTPDSQKCSTTASSNSQNCSTGGRSDSQKYPTFAAVSGSQRYSASTASVYSRRHSTCAISDSQRCSTCVISDSQRFSARASSDSRRYSTDGIEFTIYNPNKEMPIFASSKKLMSPVNSVRALLTPATSMQTFVRLVCTEETLVSSSESTALLLASTPKRYPSEVLAPPGLSKRFASTREFERCPSEVSAPPGLSKRCASTRDLDWATTPTGPEIDAAEDQDEYCTSNVSWSSPLEVLDDPPPKVDKPIKEERERQSTSVRSSSAFFPSDHFPAVYVGRQRKKFVVPLQVVTHQLFQQLLKSDYYKLEEIAGEVSVVLLCDTNYFQRLLFFIDQRKKFDIEAHEARSNVSSCSKRYDAVTHEPRVSVYSTSG